MSFNKKQINIFVTVKTYPTPSLKYKETVCTAGFTDSGEFIRLYPIPFRYISEYQQYKKYQWISAEVIKKADDPRPESFSPFKGSIEPLGPPIDTKNNWRKRKDIVLRHPVRTTCFLKSTQKDQCSLGIIKPKHIIDFVYKRGKTQWTGRAEEARRKMWLDGPLKELAKIPYKFYIQYTCQEHNCPRHKMMIEDWETCRLYLRLAEQHEEKEALSKVKQKYMEEILSPKKDVHFYLGRTVGPFFEWLIIGVFNPPLISESYRLPGL